METTEIKPLLNSPIIHEIDNAKLQTHLFKLILKVYYLAGLTRNREPEKINEEVKLYAEQLVISMKASTILRALRAAEIDYCFMNGLHGEFKDNKAFGINYQSLYHWLKTYALSQEREQAYILLMQEKEHKQLAQSCELSNEEQRKIMVDSINKAYADFCAEPKLTAVQSNSIGSLLNSMGVIPDISGVRVRFLNKEGIMAKNEDLRGLFERKKKEGIIKLIEK